MGLAPACGIRRAAYEFSNVRRCDGIGTWLRSFHSCALATQRLFGAARMTCTSSVEPSNRARLSGSVSRTRPEIEVGRASGETQALLILRAATFGMFARRMLRLNGATKAQYRYCLAEGNSYKEDFGVVDITRAALTGAGCQMSYAGSHYLPINR
jgi:hypothetical protein